MDSFSAHVAVIRRILENPRMEPREIRRLFHYYNAYDFTLLELDSDEVFIESGAATDHVYLLLSGTTSIVNYTSTGKKYSPNTLPNPQIMGAIELHGGSGAYIGTVSTVTDCILVKMPSVLFLKAIKNDEVVNAAVMEFLSKFCIYMISKNDEKLVTDPFDNFIIYLYHRSSSRELPYRLRERKDYLADYLEINERMLSNFLEIGRKMQYFQLSESQILITKENHRKLSHRYLELSS